MQLQNNNLTGTLLSELSTLSNLEYLNVSDNQLSGGIPTAFTALTALTSFNFDNNAGLCAPGYASLQTWSEGIVDWSGKFCTDRDVLVALYNATDGANWTNNTNWLTDSDLSTWYGVGGIDGKIEWLLLNDNTLSGTIPPELGQLTSLGFLELDDNTLSGTIPPELGQLTSLGFLNLSNNNLSGTIPPELGNIPYLTALDLSGNNLSGTIPPELGQLTSLEDLSLDAGSFYIMPDVGLQKWLREFKIIPSRRVYAGGPGVYLAHLLSSANAEIPGSVVMPGLEMVVEIDPDGTLDPASPITYWPEEYRLTQATQSPGTHSVPLVAGEVTLLRVFVAADKEVDATMPPLRATFYSNGALVHTADISSSGVRLLQDFRGERIPETGRMAIDVKAVPPFNLKLVPFLWRENPDYSKVSRAQGLYADDDLFWDTRNLLPVHDFNLSVREPVWTSLDPVGSNKGELLQEVSAIQTMDGASGHYMGILREGGGVAYRPGTVLVATFRALTIAHELGHNMSLGHAPCDTDDFLDPSYPYTDGNIGVWGYDFRAGTLVEPSRADLMSYCAPHWISDYHFKKALEYRLSEEARPSGKPAATRMILLWGGVNASRELFLEPTFVVTAPPSLPHENGPYVLTGEDVDGGVLFSLNFGMPEIADGDGSSSFVFALPVQPDWPDRLARIALSGPEGMVTMGSDEDRSVALLRDRTTGRVRGILRNWSVPSLRATRPTVPEPNLEVVVSRGIPDKAAWNR